MGNTSVRDIGFSLPEQVNYVLKHQSDSELIFEFPWKFHLLFFTSIGSVFTFFLVLNYMESKHTPVFIIILVMIPVLGCFLAAGRYAMMRIHVRFDRLLKKVMIVHNGREQEYLFKDIKAVEVVVPASTDSGTAMNRFICVTFTDGREIFLGYNMFGALSLEKIRPLEELLKKFIL